MAANALTVNPSTVGFRRGSLNRNPDVATFNHIATNKRKMPKYNVGIDQNNLFNSFIDYLLQKGTPEMFNVLREVHSEIEKVCHIMKQLLN